MQLKTILNHVERHKSFVYQTARWADPETKTTIEIPIEPRSNGRAICSGCDQSAPGYDRLAARRFEFVPLWQIAVYFVYAMRRVDCPRCGVRVEQIPWCDGKHSLTTTYRWFLAGWANSPLKNSILAFFNLAKFGAQLPAARKITTCVAILASHPCDVAAC